MSDYHKDKIKEQGKQIAKLEAELARVKSFILEGACPDVWEEGSRVTYPDCGECVYCEIKQGEGKG